MHAPAALTAFDVVHRYGERTALDGVSFDVAPGEIFAFVGPNGGGKTTLFRLLSTLIPLQQGRVEMFGVDLTTQQDAVRRRLGVVFQAPSLDKKLTVQENLRHQGRLYGLSGGALQQRIDALLESLSLTDRRHELTERLSGGLRRRVELAKGMLHRPALLLLDEPSAALDPAARAELWRVLTQVRAQDGVTVVMTTHLLEEAGRADRMAILHQGRIVALDAPAALQATVGGDAVTIETDDPAQLAADIRAEFQLDPQVVGGVVRLEQPEGHRWVARLAEAFPGRLQSITFSRPSLEDVFIDRTGSFYHDEQPSDTAPRSAGGRHA